MASIRVWSRTFGLLGLLLAVTGFVCWFLPFSPILFRLGIIALPTVSLLLLAVAGILGSRWWLAAVVFPLFLLIMIPQYEQTTTVKLKSEAPDGVAFQFSGTMTVGAVTVARYSADVESPEDARRFIAWRIEPTDRKSADRAAWQISTVRYGVVPTGYLQVIPDHGAPPPLQQDTIYHLDADFCSGYFEVLNRRPRSVPTPPDAPCFSKKDDRWMRIPCK